MRCVLYSQVRITHALLAAFALLTPLACAPSDAPGTIVLHVANWGGAKEGTEDDKRVEDIYREFERQNPDVRIQEESVPQDYVAKMALAYVAKAQPDIMMLDLSSSALFINCGVVSDVSPLMQADKSFRQEDFFPNVFAAATRGDKVYAIPLDFTPMVMYYNKRMFDQAGVPYPKDDWDFAEFQALARKLTIKDKQYGFAFKNWPAGWVMWLWNAGGDHLKQDPPTATGYLDSRDCVKAVTFIKDLVAEGSAPSISQAAAAGVDLFANGQAAMTISGHWDLMTYKNAPKDANGKPKITWGDIGVVPLPHEVPQSQTVMYESGYAITSQCKHKHLAWKFIRYMTSHDVQAKYQFSGIAVSARKDVAEERARASELEASFLPIIPSCRPPYGSKVEGYEFVEDQMTKAMDSVIQNSRDPYQALHKAAQAIDREFAK